MSNKSNARYKEMRVERKKIKRKHKDIFWGSSYCSTSLPSHRRISTMSTKGPPPKNYKYKSGVHNSTLSKTQSPLHKKKDTKSRTKQRKNY